MTADWLEEAQQRIAEGRKRFLALPHNECQLCGAQGPDMRGLFIDCGYALFEAVEEVVDIRDAGLERGQGYYLRICKSCRGRLLGSLREWAAVCRVFKWADKDDDGAVLYDDPDRDVPVRIDGAVQMMTREEYFAWKEKRDG